MNSNQEMATPLMEVKIDSKETQRLLRRKRYFLTDGKIQKLCAIGKYIILVYDFDHVVLLHLVILLMQIS